MQLPITFYGIIARIINLFVPIKKNHWIFGADYGNSYREGSKYLLEYMLNNHPEYNCTYITRNNVVKKELDAKGIPCELNFTIKGIVKVAQAGVVFTCHTPADIFFVYKKRNRRNFYLVHGQPYKVAMQALSKDYWKKVGKIRDGRLNVVIDNFRKKIISFFNKSIEFSDIEFMSATSAFLQPLMSNDFGGKVPVKVLGMPRCDAFFHPERFKKEKWIDGLVDKLVISYLPTHRKYGKGDLSPYPFINRPEIQEWMRNNNIVLLVKQHPNMIPKLNKLNNNDVIIDITKLGIEAQVCLYHSDVLISDYSSVWIDYLLLKRPILFYLYDDFKEDDCGTYFNVKDYFSEFVCYNEDELFRLLKSIKNNYNGMCPTEMLVRKFHKYVDGNACERYYKEIVKH